MKIIIYLAAFALFSTSGYAQNYLGYSKPYILKALKSQRVDMKGPVVVKAVNDNFIFYIADKGRRIVYYHFSPVVFTANGKNTMEEICTSYISKNACESYTNCPEMDAVIRSLDSHFTSEHYLIWVDYTKTVPHEWIIVRDANYFEVHVREIEK